MIYIIVSLLIVVAILIYFPIADKCNIIDKPNQRSSHSHITLRGGGIVYWVAALLYTICNYQYEQAWVLFVALTLVSFVSFWDDVKTINAKPRLVVQLMAMSLVFYVLQLYQTLPWWAIIIAYIVFVGILNAYNFMDGINGITGLYSLAVLGTMQYVNLYITSFVHVDFIWFPMIASVVFLFFNFRKKARCFAGDVGSITIAFWIVILLLMLMIKTNNLIWILFLAVYGVDTMCTILHRLYLKQNIFQAHRLHLYQILVNEKGWSHRVVSVLYAVLQLLISTFVMFSPFNFWINGLLVFFPLLGLYALKFHKGIS